MPRLVAALVLAGAIAAAPGAAAQDKQEALLAWQAGYVLQQRGQYAQAAEAFRRSIEAWPTAEAHTFLGWSLSHLGRIGEAIEECKKAIALDPDFGNPYNDIGVYLTMLGYRDDAPEWFRKAIDAPRYCCYHYPHTNLGHLLLDRGDVTEARRLFERALEYQPGYPAALEGLELIRRRGFKGAVTSTAATLLVGWSQGAGVSSIE
ncbi:MAG: tetratricopeptide repeat protein [Betaproteobacteria bacterium]